MSATLFGMPNLLRDYLNEMALNHSAKLRVHGNGFIQYDVDPQTRLHFWGDPRIPHQTVDTGWHDHNFNIFSTVLKGKLTHLVYSAHPDESGLHHAYRAVPTGITTQNTELVQQAGRVRLCLDEVFEVKEGETYGFASRRIHYSSANQPTITLMKKTSDELDRTAPLVFCPVGLRPDNEFHRDGFDQSWLWDIVMDMVN